VQDGMWAVSNDGGTAVRSRIHDPENAIAGKTGTSQVRRITAAERAGGVRRTEQLPWHLRNHALFVAYAPYAAPRYAVATVVEHGGGGSAAAAPVARDIMIRALYGPDPPLAAWPPEQRDEIERRRALQAEPAADAAGAAGPDRT
jgi:penicillin-binding protein 2